MGLLRILACVAPAALLTASAIAQAATEYDTVDIKELRELVERGGLDVVAVERGSMMVSNGKGFPARLTLAGCDRREDCRVVRIYTRYVIGGSEKGMAAANLFSVNFTSATLMLVMAAGEPAIDVGRDASLEGGRTEGEVLGEIATAMSDAQLLRDRLMEADPFLKAMLGRP
jgi:hypothetical protein